MPHIVSALTESPGQLTSGEKAGSEQLGIAEGKVSLGLGGEAGPLFRLKAGDMIVLPTGVGDRRVWQR